MIGILDDFYEHPEHLKEYSKNASKMAILDTSERIYKAIHTILVEKKK